MSSIIKVDTIQDQAGNNIISESANVITIGASGDTITVPAGATVSGFTSAGIDDNATSTAITIDSSENVGIGYSSTLNGRLNVNGNVGLGNFISASNPTGGTYNLTDPDGSTINQIVRIGEDDDGGNGVADLQLVAYGSNNNFGGGNLRFVNSRYSENVALIKGSREAATTGYLAFYTQYGGLKERMHIHDNGDISFYEDTGTTAKLFWDASAERLGIGTTSPSYNLSIVGNFNGSTSGRIQNLNSNGLAFFGARNSNGSGCNYGVGGTGYTAISLFTNRGFITTQSTTDGLVLNTEDTDPIIFGISNTEKMRLTSTGLGIGTSSPSVPLDIRSFNGTRTTGGVSYNLGARIRPNDEGGLDIGSTSTDILLQSIVDSGDMVFGVRHASSNVERMRIEAGGNVGINTNSPTQKLDVNGTVKATAFQGDGSALTGISGGGKILQVVQGTATSSSTTSTSFTSTGLSASITPSSTSSKILIIVTLVQFAVSTPNKNGTSTIFRGGTNLAPTGSGIHKSFATNYNSGGGSLANNQTYSYLDSPSTTSATTYTVNFAVDSGATITMGINSTTSYIQLLEIGA